MTVQDSLKKYIKEGHLDNREDGFNTAILSAMSMCRGKWDRDACIQSLKRKTYEGRKLKPYHVGYNTGIEIAVMILENKEYTKE